MNALTSRRSVPSGLRAGLLALWLASMGTANAQDSPSGTGAAPFDAAAASYRLWSGRAPGAVSGAEADAPTLTVVRPSVRWGDGTAVVIAPGGGYVGLSTDLEGAQPGQWFASRGVTAFILHYRLEPAMLPAPLLDGARAIRFVRAHAAAFGLDPRRIGMMGFSAGGHLAAMTAAQADAGEPSAVDPVERASSRPDFLVLAYPWLEATVPDGTGVSPYCDFARRLAHAACRDDAYASLVPSRLVRPGDPPTFLYHTGADGVVPVEGSVRYYLALRKAYVPAELHVFEPGDHGSGMGGSHPELSQWPTQLQEWMRQHGLLPLPSKGDARP